MVEAQHIASTMKLVDTQDEQDLLESLLDDSKPVWHDATQKLDYLLGTPFRYDPLRGGSRFRGQNDPGVFYGAQSVRTAGAELGFWRWKFLQDAKDLDRLEPVAHTAFRVEVSTTVVDVRTATFATAAQALHHPTDYVPPQAFARVAREAQVGAIIYCSVRDPQPGWCMALLTPAGFAKARPQAPVQTWFLAVTQQAVTWRRDNESMQFSVTTWQTHG